MRALKIIGISLGSLVALLVLAGGAILLWVDPNDFRGDIEKLVQDETGRSLRIGGDIDLALFPHIALTVNRVTLGNPPGFGDQPFATVDRAALGVKLMPLLSKRLEVKRVTLEGLGLMLVSRGEEVNNWKDLGESQEKEAQPATSDTELSIEGIDIEKSRLELRDEEEQSTTRLTNLALHTGALGGDEPIQVRLSFDFDQGEPSPIANTVVETLVKLDPERSRAEMTQLVAKGQLLGAPDPKQPASAAAKDEPLEYSLRTPTLTLDWDAGAITPTKLEGEVAGLPVQASLEARELFDAPQFSGELSVPRTNMREALTRNGAQPPQTRDARALTAVAMKTRFALTETQLRLTDIAAQLDDTSISGSASIDDLDAMAMSFDLRADAIDIDRYLAPEDETASKAAADEEVVPVEALRELQAKGTLSVKSLKFAGLEFTGVRVPVDARDGLVRIGPADAGLFGGQYRGTTTLDARVAQPRVSIDGRIQGVQLGTLLGTLFDTKRVIGKGDAQIALTGSLTPGGSLLQSLNGTVETKVSEGAIDGVDLVYELRRARALLRKQAVPADSGSKRTEFKTFGASARLEKGRMVNDNLRLDSQYLKASGQGSLNISSQEVDYRLTAVVLDPPAQGEGAELADLKSVEIPIRVTGTLTDMKVRPDLDALVKSKLKSEVTEKLEEKKEDLRKSLDKRLKDLFNR